MLTCMYQPPVSLGKTCLLKVNRDTKKVIVRRFSPKPNNGHVRVQLVQSYNFLSPSRKEVVDIDKPRRPSRPQPPTCQSNDEDDDSGDPDSDDSSSVLSESCGLSISELEEMAACQARQLETQEQLLAAKAQRLRYLKSGGEAERLLRLREKVATQEERLRKLRALRGKVQTNKNGNAVFSSDLESLRAVFNEKEKELSVAVAKVDELTRQLEDLRHGTQNGNGIGNVSLSNHGSNGQSPASVELEKLRRELLYRQKLRETQATRVADQRAKLFQKQEESHRVDRRIAELQERLHRKRFLNHQLAATLKQQENVEDFLENGIPTKNDSKYQTLPYNSKFTSFGVKQLTQNYQDSSPNQPHVQVQEQVAKFDKAIHQMQIISLDQRRQPQMPPGNNKMINSYGNFQQVLSQQNHQNTKSANSLSTNGIVEPNSSNGIGHDHPMSKGNSTSAVGLNEADNGDGLRHNNYLPTGLDTNEVYSTQSVITTTDVTSCAGSNGSISGSSSDGVGPTSYNVKNPRPALPPKPSKPAPPSRQASAGDAFPCNQRSLSTGDGMRMMPDRTELPIKPKPLFAEKPSSTSSSGNETIATSVPPLLHSPATIGRHTDNQLGNGSTKSNNGTVRMSINRRIEMPPAFLFPESDPPPSDLVPEQYSSSATSSLSSTSLTSSNSSTGVELKSGDASDTVDAAPVQPHQQRSHFQQGLEEYTLPDLFPTTPSPTGAHLNGDTTFKHTGRLISPNNNTNHQFPSGLPNIGIQEKNKGYSNNNYQDAALQQPKTLVHPDSNSHEASNGRQVAVMSLQLDNRELCFSSEQELSLKCRPNQRESSGAVIQSDNQSRSEEVTNDGFDSNENVEKHLHLSGIIKRLKKGNLKSPNKESDGSTVRRVSFDPLALLLDASLEGELELVMKTATEVGNPSAANDEGITALHNAICAGHSDVVRFLVEFGCDVNAQDSDGWTPLHCAASCNNTGMVKFLVEHGACIFATTLSDHETAAEKCEEDEDGFGPCSEYLYSIQEKLGIANNGAVYAVFDYEAQNSDELSFEAGNRLTVLRKGDEVEREWWWASSVETEKQGYIPRNLLGLYSRVLPEKRKAEC